MKNIIVIMFLLVVGVGGIFLFNQKTVPEMVKNEPVMVNNEPSVITQDQKKSYMDLEPKEAYELIQNTPNLVVIDVSPKYQEGHLPGAINHYIGDGSLAQAVPALDKSLTYLVYCHVDSASIPGAQMLVDAGIENVYRLKGNYPAWIEAGLPIEK